MRSASGSCVGIVLFQEFERYIGHAHMKLRARCGRNAMASRRRRPHQQRDRHRPRWVTCPSTRRRVIEFPERRSDIARLRVEVEEIKRTVRGGCC
jgi:hypothetical protein